jgi:alanine dehydrogenase
VLALANKGPKQALLDDAHLMKGLNVFAGKLTSPEVASSLGIELADRKVLVNNA